MAKWLFMVYSDCAGPSHKAEFNEWYDQTELPDVLSTPSFVPSSLYINTDPDAREISRNL